MFILFLGLSLLPDTHFPTVHVQLLCWHQSSRNLSAGEGNPSGTKCNYLLRRGSKVQNVSQESWETALTAPSAGAALALTGGNRNSLATYMRNGCFCCRINSAY